MLDARAHDHCGAARARGIPGELGPVAVAGGDAVRRGAQHHGEPVLIDLPPLLHQGRGELERRRGARGDGRRVHQDVVGHAHEGQVLAGLRADRVLRTGEIEGAFAAVADVAGGRHD